MLVIKEAFNDTQLERVKDLYETAFPASEKKPFSMILEKREEGLAEILSIEDENKQFCGLLITALYKDLVLIDYFAIDEESRGRGIGSEALKIFCNRYGNKRIFLEIESTVSDKEEDHDIKIRRKHFYQRNGFGCMPYFVLLFGVEMEIMTYNGKVSYDEYHELLDKVYGEKISSHVILLKE